MRCICTILSDVYTSWAQDQKYQIQIQHMKKNNEDVLAYIKYDGNLVQDGYLDARKSGEVLVGIDEVLRYFIYQENPEIKNFEFEIPVRIRKGSWEAIFPENIENYALGAFGLWMAGKYVGSALEEIAKNDFKDVSLTLIFKSAFENILKVVKLAKHLGTLAKKKFEQVIFSENNEFVKITNDNGEELWVSVEVLELYSNCPQTLFSKLTKIVEEERELTIGIEEGDLFIEEKITTRSKHIFTKVEDEDETVLPELRHGEYVELQGHITRGNEKANTIGFLYQGHIITCYPDSGNIKQHKSKLFNNCVLKGFVDRQDKDGNVNEKRPRIRFLEVQDLEKPNISLFD